MLVSATVLIVAGLVLGAIPGLVDRAQEAAAQFTDRALYDAAVLDRPLPVPAARGPAPHRRAARWSCRC